MKSFKQYFNEKEDIMDREARDAYGRKAPKVTKLKDGNYHAVNSAGHHKIFNDKKEAEAHIKTKK